MAYEPRTLNATEENADLIGELDGEFRSIAEAFALLGTVRFEELNVEPARPRIGLTVLADGTNWDPGSGQGVYTYYNGAWNKLG